MGRNLLKEIISSDDSFIENTLENMDAKKFRQFCFDSMRQQDRDTRYACAESILTNIVGRPSITGSLIICAKEAHNKIMNENGGIK